MSSQWYGQIEGMAPGEVPYERIYRLLTVTPRNQWRRNADGSLVVGSWRFWRSVTS